MTVVDGTLLVWQPDDDVSTQQNCNIIHFEVEVHMRAWLDDVGVIQ